MLEAFFSTNLRARSPIAMKCRDLPAISDRARKFVEKNASTAAMCRAYGQIYEELSPLS